MAEMQHTPRHARRPDGPGQHKTRHPRTGGGMKFPVPPALDAHEAKYVAGKGGR